MNHSYISRTGLEALKKELEELKTVKRREIAQRLQEATELGDLSENSEYLAAREAQRIGFVHECVAAAELDARIEQLAAQLAQAGPQALARAKRLLARVARAPITRKLAAETAALLASVRASSEAREGLRAFLEKRKPDWR